ncbi:hypothetical protein [Chryseobacterium sp. Hurlbut01]|jgi:hypothetical protein|uniref:phage tail protein n=1 Tax=Chryseobacterium sp. Hurlbut01 TaxID=1681828 RepID=UPI00067AFFFB|nr:hypothetical protein [Chryseobacterium sp. Hurlbut01]KNB60037.1 hypothetical protein AC804_12395 [Chryseobacterium sp. Hurlbut01]
MKAANTVEKDKAHHSQSKKQKPQESAVIHLSEVGTAIQKQETPNRDITTPNRDKLTQNGNIIPVHGSQTIYDQGSEIMSRKHDESLAQTGDVNHPETKDLEKGYMTTLNTSQAQNYNDLKSGTYLPQTLQEQAAVHQENKKAQEGKSAKSGVPEKSENGAGEKSASEIPDKTEEQAAEVTSLPEAKNNSAFTELTGKIANTAQSQKRHEPAQKASNDAQAAAPSPANERESMAQASKVDHMDAQKPGTFSKAEFKSLLKQKIEGIRLPKDEAEADDFEKNNNIQQVNQNAVGDVKNEKNAATNDIASATAAKPNTAAQPVRAVAKMPTPITGQVPSVPNVSKAMPYKRDSASVEQPVKEQTNTIDSEMKAHGVTDKMLANSNEPTFTEALDEKNKAKTQSVAETKKFRKNEEGELSKTRNEAQSQAAHQIGGMYNARKGGLNHAHGEKKNTATKDSQKRKEIADRINSIYNSSKKDVDTILNSLDKTVAVMFDAGSRKAKKVFEDHVEVKMKAYKEKRYGSSWLSWKNIKRVGDAIVGLPKEVNAFFVTGKQEYIKTMDRYIDEIATLVTNQLNAAKNRIAKGKKDVQTYVNSLSPSLRKIGKDAIAEIQTKFNALEESVNNKKDALIDVLAKKYAENVASIDARIEELKAQNSGLINKALNALSGVFAIIIEIKNTLTNLLSGIVEVVMAIIADPIGFFKNLIAGVGQGFANFGANIWTHLKSGFFTWLTGATKGINLTMPEDVFSLKGIFSITTQVLGLTWNGIRAIGSRVVGEPVVKVLETGFEMVQIVRKEGVAGLWEHLKDQFADLKATVMDTIMEIIQTQVIQAGIKWIMGLLTPVGAFVKAAMAIIDVVKFFIQRAAQIMELIKAFTDSVAAIASGKVGAVAKSIENALGKAVPILIGFLASLLGIGGLADKVLGVIRKIRQRIENAIVKFWTFVKRKAGKLLNKLGVSKKSKNDEKSVKKAKNNEKLEDSEVGTVINFSADGEQHKLWITTKGNNVEVMVASMPMSASERLKKWESEIHTLPKEEQGRAKVLLSEAKSQYLETHQDAKETDTALDKAKKQNASNDEIKKAEKLDAKVEDKEKRLSHTLQQLFSIFGEENELKYSIKRLVFVRNEELNIAEGKYPHDFAKQLSSIENNILKLDKNNEIRDEIRAIRRKWKIQKGALYSPFVEEYQQSFKKMREEVKGNFIITLETGGSLLGDSLTDNTNIKNIKIGKAFVKHQAQQPKDIAKYVTDFMKGREQEVVNIKIVDAMVSGTSAKNIIKNALANIVNSNRYPNLTFELHLMQETIGRNEKEDEQDVRLAREIYISEANKVELYFNKTRFTLGEDVDAQAQYNHHEPVIIFKGSDATLAAYSIIPQEGTSTRRIIIGLANGEFNGRLEGVI